MSTNDASREYVLKRYNDAIEYYWHASRNNKRWYKWTRYLTIILGAAVTLLTSLSSSSLITGMWQTLVGVVAPVIAATLTITTGLLSAFQWGAAWQEMVITAERLEQERDRITVNATSDPANDLALLNKLVINESIGFFARIMGSPRGAGSTVEPKG